MFPELWLAATVSLREQKEVVSLRFRDSLVGAESAFLQTALGPGNTHRLWLFKRPRHGGPFRGDSWREGRGAKCQAISRVSSFWFPSFFILDWSSETHDTTDNDVVNTPSRFLMFNR